MSFIKKVLRKTPLNDLIKYRDYKKSVLEWTEGDEKMSRFYETFISSNGLVFDVGANIGNRTKIFLKNGAKVIAIEPQDLCVKVLTDCFGTNPSLTIIPKVLGSEEGEAELLISTSSTISSLSQEWIEAVKNSGRFSNYQWTNKKVVSMTTLDHLINIYGIPDFIKIDVEGFEYQVLSGLSKPVKYLSFEFVPEIIDPSLKCIDHLESLGGVMFNYSIGETMEFALNSYVSADEIKQLLNKYRDETSVFGDVYCKFVL